MYSQDGKQTHTSIRHYNDEWIPQREIEIQWGEIVPNAKEYHVYVREMYEKRFHFLANTQNPNIHSLVWKPGSSLIREPFLAGPELGIPYHFIVYGIYGNPPYPKVGFQVIPDEFEIYDKIVFRESGV